MIFLVIFIVGESISVRRVTGQLECRILAFLSNFKPASKTLYFSRVSISFFIGVSCLINFNFILMPPVTWHCEDERDITYTICYHSSLSCIVWPSTLTEHPLNWVVLAHVLPCMGSVSCACVGAYACRGTSASLAVWPFKINVHNYNLVQVT